MIRKETWQRGLDSQSACNLSGLAHWLPQLFDELRQNGITTTEARNTHPLVRLVVAQMNYLAYGRTDGDVALWMAAHALAEKEAARPETSA